MIGTRPHPPQRFLAAGLILATFAGCGGGGGGGGPTAASPVIVTASFAGAGATPAAGDALILSFSTAVALTPDRLLDDADLDLSAGATLGDVTQAPTLLSATTLSITLGDGVALVPGAATIALGAGNDVVGGPETAPRSGGQPVTIETSDGAPPTVTGVTIAAVDGELNGTGPAGGLLQTPVNSWSLDLTYSDNSAIATSQTVITADVSVATSTGTQLPGANLAPFLTEVDATNVAATYTVPTSTQFPTGPLTLTVIVYDVSGLSSTPATFDLTVRPFTAALQPFETAVNASQVWFLDFSRDLESFSTSPAGTGVAVGVAPGDNGVTDFDDLLVVIGLASDGGAPNVTIAEVSERVQSEVEAQLADLYSGANVTFTRTRPAGSFGGNPSVLYESLSYSAISIGGASSIAGVVGLAIFDPSNIAQNDNTIDDFEGQRLGVFLHTIVDSCMRDAASTPFRQTFDVFSPSQGGVPIGDAAGDDQRFAGTLSDARGDAMQLAIVDYARFIAVVTAHECGHSVGLVVNGPMPNGLYGNDPVNFPQSTDGHILNTSLFPSGSRNVMSPALSYSTAISADTQFNSLNRAYLREQVFYSDN
jgi:hypothetical protein